MCQEVFSRHTSSLRWCSAAFGENAGAALTGRLVAVCGRCAVLPCCSDLWLDSMTAFSASLFPWRVPVAGLGRVEPYLASWRVWLYISWGVLLPLRTSVPPLFVKLSEPNRCLGLNASSLPAGQCSALYQRCGNRI